MVDLDGLFDMRLQVTANGSGRLRLSGCHCVAEEEIASTVNFTILTQQHIPLFCLIMQVVMTREY